MSIYIHIPFCTNICSYCDFCKMLKNDKWVDDYLIALEGEIKEKYNGEKINTLYIGGGSPSSLSLNQLTKLFKILKVFNLENAEVTMEVNSTDLTLEKLEFLKDKINRLSIGFQTNNDRYLRLLNRSNNIDNILLAKKYFSNINIDLMYGFKNQTCDELKADIEFVLSLKPTHISTYCLIIEKHTKLYIDKYSKSDDNDSYLYDFLNEYLIDKGFKHYEISNYSLNGYESKHNQVYWNNEHYYGFGLGASGYIDNIRYDNTKSLSKYLKGEYLLAEHTLTKNEIIQNEFILGFRKIKGINVKKFKTKYGINIFDIEVVKKQLSQNLVVYKDDYLFINPKYLYVSNEILLEYMTNLLHSI